MKLPKITPLYAAVISLFLLSIGMAAYYTDHQALGIFWLCSAALYMKDSIDGT
jgi:hypothetical protein